MNYQKRCWFFLTQGDTLGTKSERNEHAVNWWETFCERWLLFSKLTRSAQTTFHLSVWKRKVDFGILNCTWQTTWRLASLWVLTTTMQRFAMEKQGCNGTRWESLSWKLHTGIVEASISQPNSTKCPEHVDQKHTMIFLSKQHLLQNATNRLGKV